MVTGQAGGGTPDRPATPKGALLDRIAEPRRRYPVLVALALYPALLVLFASRLGPGVLWDSTVYASAARSFAATGALRDFTGGSLTEFPPGLPVILGLMVRSGVALPTAAVTVNVVSVAASVLLTYALARVVLRSVAAALVSAAVVGLSASTVVVFACLLSEPPFIALALSALVLAARSCRAGRIRWWEVLAIGALVSAATTVRFVGITLVPAVVIGAALAGRGSGRRRTALTAAAVVVVSSLGPALVAARNVGLGVAPFADRAPSGLSIGHVLAQSVRALGGYVDPLGSPLGVVFGVGLAGALVYGTRIAAKNRDPAALVVATFINVYWLVLWYSELAATIEDVSVRMTGPVLAPMVVLLGYAAEHRVRRGPQALVAGATGVLVAALMLSVAAGLTTALSAGHGGIGYNSLAARASPLVRAVGDLPPDDGIAASGGPHVYWVTGRTPITPIPWTNSHVSPEWKARQLRTLERRVDSGRVDYLACFDVDSEAGAMTPDDLIRAGIRMRLVARYTDGTLWRASPGPAG